MWSNWLATYYDTSGGGQYSRTLHELVEAGHFYQKTTGGHCSTNTTVLRQALYDWVEKKGGAPESLLLDTNSARPSCNYPKFPKFDVAVNTWSCVVPPVAHDLAKRDDVGLDTDGQSSQSRVTSLRG